MVICVECAAPVSCIYRRFPSSSQENIRLQRCDACGSTADKYVEYEGLLLFVELLLHKPQTYRHILFNRLPYADAGLPPPLYRLAAACILFDAYTIWFLLHVDHARFLFPSTEDEQDEEEEGAEEGEEQVQQFQHGQQRSQPTEQLLQQHRGEQHGTPQHFQHHDSEEDPCGQTLPLYYQQAGDSQPAVSSVSAVSISDVCSVAEHLPGVDPSVSCPSRRCSLYPSPVGPDPAAETTLPVGASSVDAAHPLRGAVACDSVAVAVATSPAAASAASTCLVSAFGPGAAGEAPLVSLPAGAAAPPPLLPCCGVVSEQTGETTGTAVTAAAPPPGNLRLGEFPRHAAAASTCEYPAAATLPSPTQRRPSAAAAPASQRSRASSAAVSDAERHADMLRWLLHNPVVSVDQQLLILSVSIVDFVVYIFAVIFFTDLFLRFLFRRRHTQHRRQQQQQQQPHRAADNVRTTEAAAASVRVVASPLCSYHTLAGTAAGEAESHQRKRALEERQSFCAEETRRETGGGEGETRQRQEGGEQLRVEGEGRRRRGDARTRAVEAEERRELAQQEAKELTKGKPREESAWNKDGGVGSGAGSDLEEREQRRAEEQKASTQEETQDKATFAPDAARDVGPRESCSGGEKAWAAQSSCGSACVSKALSCIKWTKRWLSSLSLLWRFALMSSSTAAREVLVLLFGCGKHQAEAAATAESGGVVLIKYNYLAAAVTLSMFGKLGTLILMAWEESLSPRCFTSLFTFTSNVLAVDVFLNSQHPAAAAGIVVAAAAVRALARLAQQVAFPSVAFPPCAVFPAAETGDAGQLSPVLNFLALLV